MKILSSTKLRAVCTVLSLATLSLLATPAAKAQVSCLGTAASIVGTADDDVLIGTAANDVIAGLAGNDIVIGQGGDDMICGGPGNDRLEGGDGEDQLEGGEGADVLEGGEGTDRLEGSLGNDLLAGGGDADQLHGGFGNDSLLGDDGPDFLWGGPGGDLLFGGAGNDTAGGGYGADFINGGTGDDLLSGGPGDDLLNGGGGFDRLNGGISDDVCFAGEDEVNCENTGTSATIIVTGRVAFPDDTAVQGAHVTVSALPGLSNNSLRSAQPPVVLGASGTALTDANGDFSVEIGPELLPLRVLVEILFQPPAFTEVSNSRITDAIEARVNVGRIIIPNPQESELSITGTTAQNADGSLRIDDLPTEVKRLSGAVFDPDTTPDAFPGGRFVENGEIPLNSSVFLSVAALDEAGNPVDDLSQAVTIRSRISKSQWPDLEDIDAGTDRIEIPIYHYDETLEVWLQEGTGWLEDERGTVLPEDAQAVILDGTFTGTLFATFSRNHFSWLNVDYAFLGPWTLSRLDPAKRNNDCLFNALNLAKTIALSAAGKAAYAKVNLEGASLERELADAKGPELENANLADVYGVYRGDSGGSESEFEMNNTIWDGCAEGATEGQKKNTTIIMTVTILHETAHWKEDVKKFLADDTDSPDEEGNQLERDLFGGIITNEGGLRRDGILVDDTIRDGWLNPVSWPTVAVPTPPGEAVTLPQKESPLELSITLVQTTIPLGEEIPVQVVYKNVSNSSIQVMNRTVLEGWPLHFEIIRQADGKRVPFLGPELKLAITEGDFTILAPGETLAQTVNLVRDSQINAPVYGFLHSGPYAMIAVYEPMRGIPRTASESLTFTLTPGGSLAGTVGNAASGNSLEGAMIQVIQEGRVLATVTSLSNGSYSVSELPSGTYSVEARAVGFLRERRNDVQIVVGQQTSLNFNLSPLLFRGELRLVLTWGENPADLDSHLWLPTSKPYHLFYGRVGNAEGNVEACPRARLDVDDRDSFGPETITIRELFEGTYRYGVHHFAGAGSLASSGARVSVFDSSGIIATFDVPTQGNGEWWNVLSIDALGTITEINTLGASPEPYQDTGSGCPGAAVRAAIKTKPE